MLYLQKYELLLAVVVAIFIGVGASLYPLLLIAPAGIMVSLLLIRYGIVRILFVVFGSLIVFQSSSGFGLMKMGYLAGVGLIVIVAFISSIKYLEEERYKTIKPIIYFGLVFLAYLIANIGLSVVKGTDLLTSIRDCSPYLILSITPILAFDFALNIKSKQIKWILIISGVYATVACIYGWYNRRYVDADTITSIGFASYIMAYAFFVYCSVNALRGKKYIFLWSATCGIILGGLALTGTRTTFFVLPIAFIFIMLSGRKFSLLQKLIRGTKVAFSIALIAVLASVFLLNVTDFDKDAFVTRLQSSFIVFDKNNLNSDLSFQGRLSQTNSAINAIKDSPIFGAGSGATFPSYNHLGQLVYRVSIDSPLALMAKQGILGFLIFVVFLWKIFAYTRHGSRVRQNYLSTHYLKGLLACTLATMVIIPVGEDKGFSLAILIFLAYSFSQLKNESNNTPLVDTVD